MCCCDSCHIFKRKNLCCWYVVTLIIGCGHGLNSTFITYSYGNFFITYNVTFSFHVGTRTAKSIYCIPISLSSPANSHFWQIQNKIHWEHWPYELETQKSEVRTAKILHYHFFQELNKSSHLESNLFCYERSSFSSRFSKEDFSWWESFPRRRRPSNNLWISDWLWEI